MIVISNSLTLVETPDINSNNPVIGWRNVITLGGLTADSADPNFPVTNLANSSTALLWKSLVTDEQYIVATINEIDPIDYVAIARHNFGTANIAVSIEGAATVDSDGEFEWEELTQDVIPADDAPIIFRFTPQSLIAVRVKMAEGDAAPYAAVMYAGRLLIVQRRVYVGHTPLSHGVVTKAITSRSESGQFLGRVVVSEAAESSVALKNLTPSWYRATMTPFVKAAQETPFFFAWRPGTYPLEVGYAWLTNDPQMTNQMPNGMVQVDLSMSGIVT